MKKLYISLLIPLMINAFEPSGKSVPSITIPSLLYNFIRYPGDQAIVYLDSKGENMIKPKSLILFQELLNYIAHNAHSKHTINKVLYLETNIDSILDSFLLSKQSYIQSKGLLIPLMYIANHFDFIQLMRALKKHKSILRFKGPKIKDVKKALRDISIINDAYDVQTSSNAQQSR